MVEPMFTFSLLDRDHGQVRNVPAGAPTSALRGPISCPVGLGAKSQFRRLKYTPGEGIEVPRRRVFGSTRLRSSGKWQALITEDGRRKSLGTFDSRMSADLAIANYQSGATDSVWAGGPLESISFRDWATDWLEHKYELKPASRSNYNSLLKNHLLPAFGDLRLRDVTPTAVRRWYSALAAEKPSTAVGSYRFSSDLQDCVERVGDR